MFGSFIVKSGSWSGVSSNKIINICDIKNLAKLSNTIDRSR
jgi:hypothetical protein